MRGTLVPKTNSIDVFLMTLYSKNRRILFDVIYVDRVVACASDKLLAITRETDGPYLCDC